MADSSSALLDTVLGVSLSRTWLGVTRTCDDLDKMDLLKADVALSGAAKRLDLRKALINTRNPVYRALTRAASRVSTAWRKATTAWTQVGVRVLRKANYDAFIAAHNDAMDAFHEQRHAFCTEGWPLLVAEAKADWGSRFQADLYPDALPLSTFDFTLEWPSLVGDEGVAGLDPAAYAKMKKLAAARLEEACKAFEKTFAAGLQELLASLQHNLTPTVLPDGSLQPRRLPGKTIAALRACHEDFQKLAIGDHHELQALVEKALTLAVDADFTALKTDPVGAGKLKDDLTALATTIHVVTGAPPVRKITRKKSDPAVITAANDSEQGGEQGDGMGGEAA